MPEPSEQVSQQAGEQAVRQAVHQVVHQVGELVELEPTVPVAGGAGLARGDDGRVVFVDGAIPGERVRAEITEAKRDFARAITVDVLRPSADRVVPPCRYVALGCGGCDQQHVDPVAQPGLKELVVRDALRRIGRLAEPTVEVGPALSPTAFRTTVRAAVVDGRAGLRAAGSHEVVPIEHCLVAHPLIDDLLWPTRFDGCDEVTVKVGAATGERLVIGAPTAAGIELAEGREARVIGQDELDLGTRAWIHEEIDGHRFRVSARSFFQTRPDGASALAAAVRSLGGDELRAAATVVDAYGGVGLLSILAVPAGARVVLVESSPSAVADARVNLADRTAKVIRSGVERWRSERADVVIADPSRPGLGRDAVRTLVATGAPVLVLVSCDAAALGRDTALLTKAGYRHDGSTLVDLFPQTHHVEVVSRFVRG